jgi:predicted amidohydrolase
MRVAVVQMTSTDDLERNLADARGFVGEAVGAGAQWVALPEMFAFMRKEGQPFPCAQGLDGEIVGSVRALAREHRIWLLGGSFPEQADGARVFNTSVLVDPEGALRAVYRKIHLFDVDLSAQGGGRFQESASIAPGDEIVVADTPFGRVGLSVCYDLRFPELYRRMAGPDLRFLCVPSAFAPQTGRDHWEVLLRARAIESQCFVLAPAQWGAHSPDRSSHGRAMIVDPWGLVVALAPDRPGVVVADCDLAHQDRIRAGLPALAHRRLDAGASPGGRSPRPLKP